MSFIKNNRDLFNAFGSVLHARGIKVEYIDDNVFVGEGYNEDYRVFYVRSEAYKFNYDEAYIKAQFTIINIDDYQFTYEELLPYYNEEGIVSPDLIMFTVWKDGKSVLGGLA